MQKTLSLKLELTAQEKKWRRSESLGELLERAAAIIDNRTDDAFACTTTSWVARRAIEAVCEEIIRTGGFTIPLRVRFADARDNDTVALLQNIIKFPASGES
jgi:hypothetical protein